MSKLSIHNGRYRITIGGKCMLYARYVWNKEHPDNQIKKGDGFVIHHKDEDELNDDPNNLEKMLDAKHRSHHSKFGVTALAKWRKENPELAKKVATNCAERMREVVMSDPKVLKRKLSNQRIAMQSPKYRKKMSISVKKSWEKRRKKKLILRKKVLCQGGIA